MNPVREYTSIVVIPTPASHYEMLAEVIDSIRTFMEEPFLVLVVDDSGRGSIRDRLVNDGNTKDVVVLCNDAPMGKKCGLYRSLAQAYQHAIENYSFKILLRMDTDALLTARGLIAKALSYLEQHPDVGILGSYTLKADGTRRGWWQWALVLMYESSAMNYALGRKPLWRDEIARARRFGYRLGENVFGGAYLMPYEAVRRLHEAGYLRFFEKTLLEEDVIFSLFVRALGMRFADFGAPSQVMAMGMYTLPISKERIIADRKAIVHSMKRGLDGESYEELTGFFARNREISRREGLVAQPDSQPARAPAVTGQENPRV